MAKSATLDQPKSERKIPRKAATEAARQLFLYGEGDGVRILSVQELSRKTGVHEVTIRERIKEWTAEVEAKLQETSKLSSAIVLSVDSKNHDLNTRDVEFIRARMNEVQHEVENLGPIIDKLEQILESICDIADKPDTVIALFDKYLRLSMNKKTLTKHFLDLKGEWNKLVGIDSMRAVAEATTKAASVAALKTQEPSPQNTDVVPLGGVFSKRG